MLYAAHAFRSDHAGAGAGAADDDMIVVYTLAVGDGPPVAQSLSPGSRSPGARNLVGRPTWFHLLDGIKCVFYTNADTTLCTFGVPWVGRRNIRKRAYEIQQQNMARG